jgi:hypothetical protein
VTCKRYKPQIKKAIQNTKKKIAPIAAQVPNFNGTFQKGRKRKQTAHLRKLTLGKRFIYNFN